MSETSAKPVAAFGDEKVGIMVCGHGSRNKFAVDEFAKVAQGCLLYTSPSPRDLSTSRMPSSA